MIVSLVIVLLCGFPPSSSSSEPHGDTFEDDFIKILPGLLHQPKFKQYSGYLSGVSDNYQLHYWLVESQRDPKVDPLVLWLNGGPGCSSMEGLLSENGPFTVMADKMLVENPYSWNKLANVLYLESPAGVGFSFAKDGNITVDDDFASLNNYHALLSFLRKFPEYQGRDFYITGESYAGVYVPTLALRVIQSKVFPLKAIAVGNGLTSYALNDNSLLYFMHFHGLFGDGLWAQLLQTCCTRHTQDKCMFTENKSPQCQALIKQAIDTINGLNEYNLYSPCAGGVPNVSIPWSSHIIPSTPTLDPALRVHKPTLVHTDFGLLFRDNMYVQAERHQLHAQGAHYRLRLTIPCVDSSQIEDYLNDQLLQDLIHVQLKDADRWEVCSSRVNELYVTTYMDLTNQYMEILRSGIRIFIYNGDIDMACNYLGDEWFTDRLGFIYEGSICPPSSRRHWLYTDSDNTQQVGGFYKDFSCPNRAKLTYVTVRGSGHMVPTDKPVASYHMFSAFISDSQL